MAAAARLAVSAASFSRLARRRIHLAAVRPFGGNFAVGARNAVGIFFDKFFELLAALRTAVLKNRHYFFFLLRFCFLLLLALGLPKIFPLSIIMATHAVTAMVIATTIHHQTVEVSPWNA